MSALYARMGVALGLLCLGVALGWTLNGWRLQSRLERASAALSQQVALVAQAREQQAMQAAQQLDAANTAAQQAIASAQQRTRAAQAQNAALQQELEHATSATRPCLSAAARGLLGSLPAFAGPGPGLRVPAPAPGAARPAAAPAAPAGGLAPGNTGQSSERALAGWVVQAAAQYEQCRAQIDGLRDWAASLPQTGLQTTLQTELKTDLLSDSHPRK